jgi:hypothetical protein
MRDQGSMYNFASKFKFLLSSFLGPTLLPLHCQLGQARSAADTAGIKDKMAKVASHTDCNVAEGERDRRPE